jgi:hypothetical protein
MVCYEKMTAASDEKAAKIQSETPNFSDHMFQTVVYAELAESIVRECAMVASLEHHRGVDVAPAIMRHFGIE